MDAFDADVLIYAASPLHPLGRKVAALFGLEQLHDEAPAAGVGSVLLLPEVLGKPLRDGRETEVQALTGLLARLDLQPVDVATAHLATAFSASYGLRAADGVHLATAVVAGADRFLTNNRRDFRSAIAEIDVVYPVDLPDPAA